MDRVFEMHVELAARSVGVPSSAVETGVGVKFAAAEARYLLGEAWGVEKREEFVGGRGEFVPVVVGFLNFDGVIALIPDRAVVGGELGGDSQGGSVREEVVDDNVVEGFRGLELRS